MPPFAINGIRIAGVAAAVPVRTEYNNQLPILGPQEKSEILHKAGIGVRRVAPAGLCASDLCIVSARRLLASAGIDGSEIGVLAFVTQTPDYLLPGNSMLAQQSLGIPAQALLLDLHQGCAGYIYGLSVITAMMAAAGRKYGLLLVGDTITRLLSRGDRTTLPIFGDAGSATLLSLSPAAPPLVFHLGADGGGCGAIRVEAGGSRHPFTEASMVSAAISPGVRRAPMHMAMEGVNVLNFSLRNVVPNIRALMEHCGRSNDDIDQFVLHQANRILNDSITKRLGIPAEKAPETLSVFGNTSCATIPLTLVYRLGGCLRAGPRKLLLAGFGAGFSWGSALVEMGPCICPDLIETDSLHE